MVKIGELMMILELHRQGLSVSAIARRAGMDRKTVRKYIATGAAVPRYGPRAPRPRVTDRFATYVAERLAQYPELSNERLLREVREMGYPGGRTALGDLARSIRPPRHRPFEVRFETPAGHQAQVDFAHFHAVFDEAPQARRSVWLFSLVLGHSRYLWARFVEHQDLQTVIRCHLAAFEHLGGAPAEILYDRMKTAVLGEAGGEERHIVYNAKLLDLAAHFGFTPRACRAYRAKTKGKVERPYRYIRQDFFLARRFASLGDLNAQLAHWLEHVANARVHGTTQRVVAEHFAEERCALRSLPAVPFTSVIRLERRITHDGYVSVGGNLYSVPDTARRRVVEVHTLANEIRVYEDGALLAAHAPLEGRRRYALLPGHRAPRECKAPAAAATPPQQSTASAVVLRTAGHTVARRPLTVYEAVGRRLAATGVRP